MELTYTSIGQIQKTKSNKGLFIVGGIIIVGFLTALYFDNQTNNEGEERNILS